MREQTQCANCDLVQFRTKRNVCPRCHAPLPERQPAALLEIPAPERSPHTVTLAVTLGRIPPLQETVRRAVLDAVDKCDGNVMLAANCLEVGKTTLYRYLRQWGWTRPYKQPSGLIREAQGK
jgi:DNA-binding NtrC family response regulator